MASLTLKNLPDELLAALHGAAERDRRSLTQEIIHFLDVAVRGDEGAAGRAARSQAQLAVWRKLAGRWTSDVGHATESKRIMDRRTKGRQVDL